MLIWVIHPRARKQLKTFGFWESVIDHPSIILLEPIGYHEMPRLNMGARIMLTDSGGFQEGVQRTWDSLPYTALEYRASGNLAQTWRCQCFSRK